jgi:hypothetical protein
VKKSKIPSETKLIKETMLFACHSGVREGRIVGVTSQDAIPLSFSRHGHPQTGSQTLPRRAPKGKAFLRPHDHDIESAEVGISMAYEFFPTLKDFFRAILGPLAIIDGYHSNSGIWAYDVEYNVDSDGNVIYPDGKNDPNEERWDHLRGGKLRRPAETECSFLVGNEPTEPTMGWVLL